MQKPKVSILCITYNHVDYIEEALKGFLMQKTNFDFEILINDDASTDGTTEIIKQYQEKYPQIIKPIIQKENLYSKGFRGIFTRILFPEARGEYLALCEGDDYWTDPKKLQTQVDFMENNHDYSVCFHKVKVVYQSGKEKDSVYPDVERESWYTLEQLLRANYIQTNSVLYRKQDYRNLAINVMPGDWYMHLYHAKFGKIKLIDKVMSVYRKHEGGIWWDYDINKEKIWRKHGTSYVRLLNELLELYGSNKKYRKIIDDLIISIMNDLSAIDKKHKGNMVLEVVSEFPYVASLYINNQYAHSKQLTDDLIKLRSDLLKVGDERNDLQKKLFETEVYSTAMSEELKKIKEDRLWRAVQKARELKQNVNKKTP